MSEPSNPNPWQWHIEETFKGLIRLSVELAKILVLINGSASVALLAFVGNFGTHIPTSHLEHLRHALRWYCYGLASTAALALVAYVTQLRLYSEERSRHETGKKPCALHIIGLVVGFLLTVFAIGAFIIGCVLAEKSML
jgi:uncharacterized membrane protein YfcA